MHNEQNDNSATPEKPATYHYDELGRLVVKDVIKYFQDTMERPDIYSFRLYLTGPQETVVSLTYTRKSGSVSIELPIEQAEALWSHIVKSQYELMGTYGVSVKDIKDGVNRRHFSITKKTRISADAIIQKPAQREAYDFLEAAYSAGVNIVIEGQTYSGKTLLLNTLMDSAKDYARTVFIHSVPEMMFGYDHREITGIRSDDPSNLIYQVRRMDPPRVVMDDVFISAESMKEIVSATMSGMQFVTTGYTSGSEESNPDTDPLSSRYVEHPYELRVHVGLSRFDDSTKPQLNILSVKQIVHQKIRGYDITSNRLLFDNEKKVAEPTRTLRRKMEFARHRSSEAEKANPANKPVFVEKPVPVFVSITPEEKMLLDENRQALHEHFQTQNVALREKFEAIDLILAKF